MERPRVFRPRASAGPRGAADRLRAAGARPVINEATIRLLTRMGIEVVFAAGDRAAAARSTTTWATTTRRCAWRAPTSTPGSREMAGDGLDAIVINASGCGTTVKDYGFMFREEAWAERRRRSPPWPRTSPRCWTRFAYAPTPARG